MRAKPAKPAGADLIASTKVVSYGPTGAKFAVAYEASDRAPMTTAVRICINKRSGEQVLGTSCVITPVSPGSGSVSVNMSFSDSTAMVIKRNGEAVLESCLETFGKSVKQATVIAGTCSSQPW